MEKTLLGLLCLALIVIMVVNSVHLWRIKRVRHHTTQVVCIACRGRGSIVDQTRTLEFDGTGFVDETPRGRNCPACGGTGRVIKTI